MKSQLTNFNNIILAAALVVIAGCTTTSSQLLMSPSGRFVRCAASGAGAVGTAIMAARFDKCVEDYQTIGYEKIETAGATGITNLVLDGKVLKITAIAPNSPASKAGIKAGDTLISVNGLPRSDLEDARQSLFGRAGTDVSLIVKTNGESERNISLTRVTYPSIYSRKETGSPVSK